MGNLVRLRLFLSDPRQVVVELLLSRISKCGLSTYRLSLKRLSPLSLLVFSPLCSSKAPCPDTNVKPWLTGCSSKLKFEAIVVLEAISLSQKDSSRDAPKKLSGAG